MAIQNDKQRQILDDDQFSKRLTLVSTVLLMGIYLGVKANSFVYGIVGSAIGLAWGLVLPRITAILAKWDKHNISQKLPEVIANFLRKKKDP